MNRQDRHAQALDACLEQMQERGLPAATALATCPVTVEAPERLAELLALAGALEALPPAPDPAPDFVAALAGSLAEAAPPRRLAPPRTAVRALDATLAGAAAFEDAVALAHDAPPPELSDALLELAGLAGALERLPKAESPSDVFVASLARSLAEAPAPAGLTAETSPAPAPESTLGLVHALERGLDALGEAGLGAAIDGQDPRVVGDLAPLLALAGALRDLPPPPRPTDRFREQLAADLATAEEPRSIARRRAERSAAGLLRRLWRSTAFTAAAAATVILFLAAGVTYASADALPGQWLYPVKRAAESARLWLAPEEARIGLHLGLADRRLDETLAVPAAAGAGLAEFSREVTAALVEADAAMQAGRPRRQIAEPVLAWLIEARGRLVLARPQLPPTAWRGALALVDEAILALQSGQPLSAPVPRLFDHDQRLLLASTRPVARLRRPLLAAPTPTAAPVLEPARDPQPARLLAEAPPPTALALPPPPAPAPRDPDAEEPPADRGDSVVSRPTNVPPPTLAALILPTLTAAPTLPPAPSATPTAEPSPTALPAFPPQIVSVGCFPRKILEAGEAKCLVEVEDPDDPAGDGLQYHWWVAPYQGVMIDPDEQQSTYWADFNASGLKQAVVITIEVTDASGNQVSADTTVEVLPTGVEMAPRD